MRLALLTISGKSIQVPVAASEDIHRSGIASF